MATEQALALRKQGHEVVVCAERMRFSDPRVTRISGVQLYRYGSPVTRFFLGSSITDIFLLPKLIRRLQKKYAFDCVIAHHVYPGYAFVRSRIRVPLLYVFHASTAREAAIEVPIYWKRGVRRLFAAFATDIFIRVTTRIERTVLSSAERIVAFSQFSFDLLEESYSKQSLKAEIVPVGVDVDAFVPSKNQEAVRTKLGFAPDRFYFFTVRRLTPRMGLGALIEAMQVVTKKFNQVHLLICGSGPLRKTLDFQIKKLGLTDAVTLLGYVSERDLKSYYQAADCFVLPSSSFEGFGMATAEAMASGLPVLGTPIGATPELLRPVDPTLIMRGISASDIAHAMMGFLRKKCNEQEIIRKQSRQSIVERYSWDKAMKALERVFQKIV